MSSRKKSSRVKVRRSWALNPVTRVIPDKRLKPHRKRKHKGRPEP